MLRLIMGSAHEHLTGEQSAPAGEQLDEGPWIVGRGMRVTGEIETKGRLEIEGEVQGEISAASVRLGERARVVGSITGGEIVVSGQMSGTIRGKRVLLEASSRVEADIFHETLVIKEGAEFQGKFFRSAKTSESD
jgi:cytoskeletal protein CcmA (bactofilin family)